MINAMGSFYRTLTMLICLAAAISSFAQQPVQLQGEYQLGGPLDHNGSILEGDSHLYISLSNEAAKTLYQSLPGDPFDDACTGYKLKAHGNVVCFQIKPEEHFCSFSVNLERNAVEAGLGGCF